MRRPAEWLVFGIMALGLHAGALVAFRQEPQDGATSSGAAGKAMVSLEAANVTVTNMVAEWDRPPEVADAAPPTMPDAPVAPTMTPPPPMTAETPPPAVLPDMLAPDLESPALPVAPQAPPPDPVQEAVTAAESFAPPASVRPVNRPARRPPPPATEPARQATPEPAPQRAAPTQRAAGQSGGAGAGNAGTSPAATASAAEVQSLMARWGGEIRSRIERRKSYPRAAGGASGTVQVAIRLGTDGHLQAIGIAGSSGNAALDQAALTAVQRAGRFPAAPAGIGVGTHSFTLPMAFSR